MQVRGLASHLIGREVLKAAARVLQARSIPIMPLKGIWLQQLVYDDPGTRPITDVDILVPDTQFDEALDTLRAAGWNLLGSNESEAAVRAREWPLPLDVHRRLFTRAAFRMPNTELFARGTRDRALYDVDLILPHPLDVFAHLVGHFVKSRGGRDTRSRELRDLPALAARFSLDPPQTARHLKRCGLARAGRYALQCVPASEDTAGFCAATLACFEKDRVGDLWAGGMLALRARVGVESPIAVLPGFMLEGSLPRAFRSMGWRIVDRWRERSAAAARSES